MKYLGNYCKIQKVKDRNLYKKLLSYSGWDLIGNFGSAARSQGVNLILNLFCGPAVNAARGIAYQVEAALYQFTTNFLQASRPVIIKKYAAGETSEMLSLLYNTSKYASLLFSCFAIPFIFESDTILKVWLVAPPRYASLFLKIVLANYIIIAINNTIGIGVHATGDVKRLNIYAGSKIFVEIPLVYLFLKVGYPPYSAFVVLFFGSFVVVWINLWILKLNICEVSFSRFTRKVLFPVLFYIAIPTLIIWSANKLFMIYWYLRIPLTFIIYFIIELFLILYIDMKSEQRKQVYSFIQHKIKHI